MGKKAALAKARQSLELPAEATEDEMTVALRKLDGQTSTFNMRILPLGMTGGPQV